MVDITIVNGAYKPTYNWGASHCRVSTIRLVVYRISLAHPQCLQLLARTLNKIASADAVSTATATALRITRHGGHRGERLKRPCGMDGWVKSPIVYGPITIFCWWNLKIEWHKITIFGGFYVLIVAGEIRMIVLYPLILGFDPKLYVG